MNETKVEAALEDLASTDPARLGRAVEWLGRHLVGLPDAAFRASVEALCGLFFVDTFDRPDLEPLLARAETTLVHCGPRVIPQLLGFMKGSDIKSHFHLARALGRIGTPAIEPLRKFVATEDDPYCRSFGLFALGKIRDPEVNAALPEVAGCLMHPDREVRDSAARTLGRIVEVVPASLLSERRRTELFDALARCLSDAQPVVRAKTIRSLGKMGAAGYLSPAQVESTRQAAHAMLGHGEQYEWDLAYIVRREAQEALRLLG